MTWLWGCLIIFFKGCIGSVLFTIGIALIALIGSGAFGLIAFISDPLQRQRKEKKKPEDWKEWAEKQEGDLKSLMSEIDKELENEDT